jgi:ABC-2 type transport system permease protein
MSAAGASARAPQKASSQALSTRRPATGRIARLRLHVSNIYRLIIKELYGLRSDPIMLALVAYSFTIAVYAIATGAKVEATNLSVGIVDEDRSDLSRQIRYSFAPPTFKSAVVISADEIDAAMNSQRFLFVIEIPSKFESNILAGRQASAQINIDATAVAQAFNGMSYIQNVIQTEVMDFVTRREGLQGPPVMVVTRAMFNPNFISSWFTSVMGVINNLTMLTVILTGAALIREREQGTVEHLLVMPVVPFEIMTSKIIANGIVILIATALSLALVVEWWLQVPVAGSRLLFIGGSSVYVFTVAALGILLGTIASTMGQFGLLCIPVLLVMMLLSGSSTPMESMPIWLQYIMNVVSPTPHFVVFAQDVLYRGAGFSIVWKELVSMLVIGGVYFAFALHRFRRVIFGS